MSLPQHLHYRPDVDGLRTIAVLAVVIYHAIPSFLAGGFIGVDIFFVISGYLITRLILTEIYNSVPGRPPFNFWRFYARRLRRLSPALILVLITTLVAGWYFLLADEYKELGKEIIAGTCFVENLYLWGASGYFDSAAELKPLLHLWSLGVEEQFYCIWPILLVLAFKRRTNIKAVIFGLAITSFFINVASIHFDISATFYLPITRIWQFMAGAWLAANSARTNITGRYRLLARRLMPEAAWPILGLALIICSAFGLNKSIIYPGWWALVPTIGAYLIISGNPGTWLNKQILGSRILTFFGRISYPIYLWHWPIFFFIRTLYGTTVPTHFMLAAIIPIICISYITYLIAESPVRYSKFRFTSVSLICILAIITFVAYNIYDRNGLQFRLKGSELQRVKFNNTLSYQEQCRRDFPFSAHSFCLRGSETTSPTIALIGDSHAQSLFQGLGALFAKNGENLVNFGAGGGIPLFGVERIVNGTTSNYGAIFNPAFKYVLENKKIKTIILMNKIVSADSNIEALKYTSAYTKVAPLDIYATALEDTIVRILSAKKEIVFVIDNPLLDFDPATCIPRPSTFGKLRQPCAMRRAQYDRNSSQYRKTIETVLQRHPSVKRWDLAKLLCDRNYCWAMRDGRMLYNRDGTHLSIEGSRWLAEHYAPE